MRSPAIFVLALALSAFYGCHSEDTCVPPVPDNMAAVKVRLSDSSQSVSDSGQEEVRDFLVMSYDSDGNQYSVATPDRPYLLLEIGGMYDIFAMVNIPGLSPSDFPTVGDILEYKYAPVRDLEAASCPPASGSVLGWTQRDAAAVMDIPCRCLFSRYDLCVNSAFSDLSAEFVVESVQVRQSAASILLFSKNTASSADDVTDGYRAAAEDLEVLNSGSGRVSLYMFENMQGSPAALAGNRDIYCKVPESVPEIAARATYLEVCGKYSLPDYVCNITCRLYLGKDAYGNFDVERGVCHRVDLTFTDDALNGCGWIADIVEDDRRGWRPSSFMLEPLGETYAFAPPCAAFRMMWEDEDGNGDWVDSSQFAQLTFRILDEKGTEASYDWEVIHEDIDVFVFDISFRHFAGMTYSSVREMTFVAEGPNGASASATIRFYRIIACANRGFFTYNATNRGVHPYGILSLGFIVTFYDGDENDIPYITEDVSRPYQYIYAQDETDLFWMEHEDPIEYLEKTSFRLHTYKTREPFPGVVVVDSEDIVDTEIGIPDSFENRYE